MSGPLFTLYQTRVLLDEMRPQPLTIPSSLSIGENDGLGKQAGLVSLSKVRGIFSFKIAMSSPLNGASKLG